jgi:PhnB protein
MRIEAYLSFEGRCEEAIEFYQKALGAKVQMLMRMKDAPEQPPPEHQRPGTENNVMHASLTIGETTVMMTDGMGSGGGPKFAGITLALQLKTEAEAQRYFGALGEGGQVVMPLGKTFFSPCFGMVNDRFGVSWMVNVVTE